MASKGRKGALQAELNSAQELTIFLEQCKDNLICWELLEFISSISNDFYLFFSIE